MSERWSLDPALDRLLRAARYKRERYGAGRDATVKVSALDDDEAFALDGLLAAVFPRKRSVLAGQAVRLKLSELEAALQASGLDPRKEYERVAGGAPLRDLPAEQAAARHARQGFRAWVLSHPEVRARPALAAWIEDALDQGRFHQAMRPVLEQALAVLAVLPASTPVQRTVLAARALNGDPHALDPGTPAHGLVVTLLGAEAGIASETGAREVWRRFGVIVDPVSSNVLGLALPLTGDGVAARMVAAARGDHVVLTHAQLAAGDVVWPADVRCFSCENPSVLIAAERALGASCAPLVCTAGYPSDAARLLLSLIARAGGEIRHHGDFDTAGLAIFRDLSDRYGAKPWRYGLDELRDVAGAALNRNVSSVEQALVTLDQSIPEELVIDDLLIDLDRG